MWQRWKQKRTSPRPTKVSFLFIVMAIFFLVIGTIGYQRLRLSRYERHLQPKKSQSDSDIGAGRNGEVYALERGKVRDREGQTSVTPTHTDGRQASTKLRGIAWAKQQQRDKELVDPIKVHGLLKYYNSFTSYVIESRQSESLTPLPLVRPFGEHQMVTIPLLIIIGAQKGGTTSLRTNLLKHPLVSGMPREVHFFDMNPDMYPETGDWHGDYKEVPLLPAAVGEVLTQYGLVIANHGPLRKIGEALPQLQNGVVVESSPRYLFHPVVPYRMKMVMPLAKMVVVLRDPIERYFSHLRMVCCKHNADSDSQDILKRVTRHFHHPFFMSEYLKKASEAYQSQECWGDGLRAEDLWNCYEKIDVYNPLLRGLYADQLERWFKVFDDSQILVVSSEEMYGNFTYILDEVAAFAGLPAHDFEYDPHHAFHSCSGKELHRDGVYTVMKEGESLLREWYYPHNKRLFDLLGRDLGWNDAFTGT